MQNSSKFGLTSNALKIIAAVTMLIDHIGYVLFPRVMWLRIIGRIAFPIYAYFIAEGCRYTKNKLKYFLFIFLLGFGCHTVYYVFTQGTNMNVLFTFSVAIPIIYVMDELKKAVFLKRSAVKTVIWCIIFAASVFLAYFINLHLDLDYGFFGCMLPVFAAVLHLPKGIIPPKILTYQWVHTLCATAGMILLVYFMHNKYQNYCFLALPFLFMYNGNKGKLPMKYFFYVFYPLHLGILHLIDVFFI